MTAPGPVRLTVAQALVRFLAAQRSERDGAEQPLFARLLRHLRPRQPGRASARRCWRPSCASRARCATTRPATSRRWCTRPRRSPACATGWPTWACTSSVGPGATNMVTGAALATINRLPVLLLPGDVFATRVAPPVLQELEYPGGYDVSVNDAFRPVSRFFDRIWRPEQLPSALLGAMRVLTDPADTGAVTIALPAGRAGGGPRLAARAVRPAGLARAAAGAGAGRAGPRGRRSSASAQRPLIVAGGGVIYSGGHRRAAGVRRGGRHPGRRDPGRQGRAALRPPAGPGRGRQHRHDCRQPDGRPCRRGHRDRHPVQRLHHRLPHGVRRPAGPFRQYQRRRRGRGQAGRHGPGGRRARGAARAGRRPGRVVRRRRLPRGGAAAGGGMGRDRRPRVRARA